MSHDTEQEYAMYKKWCSDYRVMPMGYDEWRAKWKRKKDPDDANAGCIWVALAGAIIFLIIVILVK